MIQPAGPSRRFQNFLWFVPHSLANLNKQIMGRSLSPRLYWHEWVTCRPSFIIMETHSGCKQLSYRRAFLSHFYISSILGGVTGWNLKQAISIFCLYLITILAEGWEKVCLVVVKIQSMAKKTQNISWSKLRYVWNATCSPLTQK